MVAMNTRTFADWLVTTREEQGYSKNALAQRSGVNRSHLYKMESGEIAEPAEDTRQRLHAVFGTSDDDLVQLGILEGKTYQRAGVPVISPHGMRHSYATISMASGVPVKVIADALGHASVSITMDVYQHHRRSGCSARRRMRWGHCWKNRRDILDTTKPPRCANSRRRGTQSIGGLPCTSILSPSAQLNLVEVRIMGREIRRVPANWDHPIDGREYRPMFEGGEDAYRERYQEWKEERGTYGENGEPYEPEDFIPTGDWWQLFENVTEGTPITPPFATSDELVTYLVEHGDFWRKRWTREQAEAIVAQGYAPSFVMVRDDAGTTFMDSQQAAEWMAKP